MVSIGVVARRVIKTPTMGALSEGEPRPCGDASGGRVVGEVVAGGCLGRAWIATSSTTHIWGLVKVTRWALDAKYRGRGEV